MTMHGVQGDLAPAPEPFIFSVGMGLAVPSQPRQRAKLWELNGSVHCSIIGTCLTPAELRRVMGRVTQGDVAHLSDYDLHARAVGVCGQHNAGAKLLQKALDRRHAAVIQQFARLQGEAAVTARWREARASGAIPGAYWAALTHPDAGHETIRRIFGDVHMLSHLIGAANRADIQRLTALDAENAALLAKVERQQQRLHDAVTARDALTCRLANVTVTAIPQAQSTDALRDVVADLQDRVAGEIGRRERLERRVADMSDAAQDRERRARERDAECAALRRELALLDQYHGNAEPACVPLPVASVLYVGGRPSCVEQMRALLDAAGGALLVHDGGRHDHPSLLPGLIGRAEWVVFPVDCVSHDAALAVKRVCRRLGKRWLPLRTSGVGSFLAALACPAEHGSGCDHGATDLVAMAS